MALILFGIEAWVATILWTMVIVSWYARRRVWWRLTPAFLATLAILVPWALVVALVSAFYTPAPWQSLAFLFAIILLALLIGAMLVVWVGGLRRQPPIGNDPNSDWSLGRIAIAAIVATVLAQSTLWMYDAQTRENLTDLRREAQVLAQSVAPQPLVDAENAAPLYYEAFDALGCNFQFGGDLPPLTREEEERRPKLDAVAEEPGVPDFRTQYWRDVQSAALTPQDDEGLRYDLKSPRLKSFLERNQHVREILIRAARMPGCSFQRDYTRPSFDILLPEVQNLREAARYLRIDALYAAANGDYLRAAEDIQAIYGIAGHAAQEPWLVCTLVGIALEQTAAGALQGILAENASPGAGLLDIELRARTPYIHLLDRVYRAEEATGMMMIAQLDFSVRDLDVLTENRSSGFSSLLALYSAPLVRACFLDASAMDIRRTYRDLRNLNFKLQRPAPGDFATLDDFDKREYHTPLVRGLVPALAACTRAAIRADTTRRQLDVGLALYRYYHALGDDYLPRRKFPATLDELVPGYLDFLPSDPATAGRPFHYRLTERGCLIYGLGMNLTDDNGVVDKKHYVGGDLVFECLAPPAPVEPPAPDEPPTRDEPAGESASPEAATP